METICSATHACKVSLDCKSSLFRDSPSSFSAPWRQPTRAASPRKAGSWSCAPSSIDVPLNWFSSSKEAVALLATEMSHTIRECQHHGITPARLLELSQKPHLHPSMACKLKDIALIFSQYEAWLDQQRLHDPDHMLDLATQALAQERRKPAKDRRFLLEGTVAGRICLSHTSGAIHVKSSSVICANAAHWLSVPTPFHPRKSAFFHLASCPPNSARMNDLAAAHEHPPTCELLERSSTLGRFADAPMLQWLEASWTRPSPCPIPEAQPQSGNHSSQLELGLPKAHQEPLQPSIEMMSCSTLPRKLHGQQESS